MKVPETVALVKRQAERVAQAHEVKRYYLTDREWELAAQQESARFARWRKEHGK